jgi:hypothetical protein
MPPQMLERTAATWSTSTRGAYNAYRSVLARLSKNTIPSTVAVAFWYISGGKVGPMEGAAWVIPKLETHEAQIKYNSAGDVAVDVLERVLVGALRMSRARRVLAVSQSFLLLRSALRWGDA